MGNFRPRLVYRGIDKNTAAVISKHRNTNRYEGRSHQAHVMLMGTAVNQHYCYLKYIDPPQGSVSFRCPLIILLI